MTVSPMATKKHKPKKIRMQPSQLAFNIIAYTLVIAVTLFCLIPFLTIISGSFSKNSVIMAHGYSLLPQEPTLAAYKAIFSKPDRIMSAYAVTGLNTLAGTATGLVLMSMAGFVLSRKTFRYRNTIMFLIYFTTLFGGGLVPWYIMMTKVFQLRDSYLALFLPMLVSPFLIILMRTFVESSFPDEVMESAIIDGAGYFRIYQSIVLPIIVPGLAAVGLLQALGYWNDWYLSSLFINTPSKFELQYYLYNMISSQTEATRLLAGKGVSIKVSEMPTQTVKLAMAVVVTGPVLLFYPFVQRYFIAGITVGAVKG